MSVVGSTLMKRGFEAHAYMSEKKVKLDMPPWVVAMFAITFVVFVFTLFMIEYTFGRVIPTLLMIESPRENIAFEPLPTEENGMIKDPEPVSAQPKFITSSFRSSIQLLRSKDGFRGRFRGLWIYIAHNMAVQFVAGLLRGVFGFFPLEFYVVAAAVLCAQLSLGWTLIVITESSPKFWFRRLPPASTWKKVAGPTAMYAVAQQIAVMAPIYLAVNVGLTQEPRDVADLPLHEQKMMVLKGFGIFMLALCLSFFLVLPANVTLTRVEASLVSDAEETIVPFDRTFGGKVIPEIVGGSGVVSIVDAFKTFDWAARVRLLKAYVKVAAMVVATWLLFTVVVVAQCFLFAPNIHKIIVPADGN